MAEDSFEREVSALFAQGPSLADADDFAAGVERRATADQRMRRLALTAAAGVGGVLGLWPLVTSDVPRRAGAWMGEAWTAAMSAQVGSPALSLALAAGLAMAAATLALTATRDV